MKLQYLSILLTDDDGGEHLHEGIRMTNADDLVSEKQAVKEGLRDREKQAMAYMTLKAWAACMRRQITTEPYRTFANRIVDYSIEMRDVDPTQLAGATTSPSPSPASTADSSSGSPATTTD